MTAVEALLWDMDGLLVDSEPLWTVAETDLAARLGGTFTDAVKAAIVGTRLDVAVPTLLRALGVDPTPDAVAAAQTDLLARMVELLSGELHWRAGAVELLEEAEQAGLPQALVSSSYRVLVDAVLSSSPVRFAATVAGDEVAHGKPDPEPYLTAASALGADVVRCVVLEDSPAGVRSGELAGCAVVAVPSVDGVSFEPAPRRLVARSLAEVRLSDLRELAAQPPLGRRT